MNREKFYKKCSTMLDDVLQYENYAKQGYDVDQIYSDTITSLIKNESTIINLKDNKLKAYIRTSMRSKFYDMYRKKSNNPVNVSYDDDIDSTNYNIVKKLVYTEDYDEDNHKLINLELLNKYIDKLTPAYKKVFELYFQGSNHKEIAKKLGIHIGTSKTNYMKAKKRLLEFMKEDNINSYSDLLY